MPLRMKKKARLTAAATTRHFTYAELAIATRLRISSQRKNPATMPAPSVQFARNHEPPANPTCNPNRIRPGTHVTIDSIPDQHRQPGEGVAPACERPAEVERQRVVGEIGRDQAGPGQRREEDREAGLDVHEDREEPPVDLDELPELRIESLQQLRVIGQIDEAGAQQRATRTRAS